MQRNGVRYSELVRLPYFDIVRMVTVDPMLLGMVKRETELNLDVLTPAEKKEFLRRFKKVRLPYNISRLPSNIFDYDGLTAAQWKTYIITCARPCMYKLLPPRAYKNLALLVSYVSSPILTLDDIAALQRTLQEHLVVCMASGLLQ